MQIMIKEELFGQDWIEEETKQIAFTLKRFNSKMLCKHLNQNNIIL